MSIVESKDDERPSWSIPRIQNAVFIYEAAERFGCLVNVPAFRNVLGPAMVRFTFVADLLAVTPKLETVILTNGGRTRSSPFQPI